MEPIEKYDTIHDFNLNVKSKGNDGTEGGFCLEQEASKLSCVMNEQQGKAYSRNHNNGDQLSELEHQVENAEVRCDTLKQQLEFMRMLYKDKFNYLTELEKSSDNEESFQCPESDTISVNKDSMIDDIFQMNMPVDNETLSFSEPGIDLLCSPSIDDIEVQCNNSYEESSVEVTNPLTVATDFQENNCSTLVDAISETLSNCSQEHSVKEISINNTNIVPNQSDIYEHSILTKEMDNTEYSVSDNYDKSTFNTYNNTSDTPDPVMEVTTNNGVINPVKAIHGILSGISDSVQIISQLSVHASDTGKNECVGRHVSDKQISLDLNCEPKNYILENPQTMPELKVQSDFSDSILKDDSYFESKHSNQHRCRHHKHHHHHHQHSCHRHHCTRPKDSLSCWSNIYIPDHASVYTTPDFTENLVHDSYKLKRKNRHKENRERSMSPLRMSMDVQSQKSSPGESRHCMKPKSKKHSKAGREQFIDFDEGKMSQRDLQTNKREKCGNINDIIEVAEEKKRTEEKEKQRREKKMKPQFPIQDTRESNYSGHTNSCSVVKVDKRDTINAEDLQKHNNVVSVLPVSKHVYKNVNKTENVKNEVNKQISFIKTIKNFDQSPVQGNNGKFQNEISSAQASQYGACPNFSTPTVSSKLKQVDKPLMNLFNFRNIPFVVGTSTSRSHNLALNLQQALSIIKLRSSSLSIGSDLATEVSSSIFGPPSRPSSAGSCTSHKTCCPVALAQMKDGKSHGESTNRLDYTFYRRRSQKMAAFEDESETLDSASKSEIESSFSEMRKENVWEVYQNDENTQSIHGGLRCTCFPTRPCMDYQKLLYEYLSNGEDMQYAQLLQPSRDKKEMNPHENICRPKNGISETVHSQQRNIMKDVALGGGEGSTYGQIQAQSRELKDVLINLHKDFMRLNGKYEQIQSHVESPDGDGRKATKELEILESELEAKENDILVVLELHKQLMSLKQQVKALRLKASSQINMGKPGTPIMLPREPTVSIRLTRLLRTIQKFQDKLLNE